MTTRAERLGHVPASPARIVAEVAVVSALFGVLMGVLWQLLAPEVVGTVMDGGLAVGGPEAEKLFDRDAVFALLGAGCGLVMAVAFAVRHPRRPVVALVALAAGGVGGSLLATVVGGALGPDRDLSGLADGAERAFPLELQASAALVMWPMTATVVVGVIALFRDDRRPTQQG